MEERLAVVEGQLDNADTIYRNVLRTGSPGLDVPFGRNSRRHKVATTPLGEYIDRVMRRNVMHRNESAGSPVWVTRAEEGDLR
ncbi:hypothetical protein SMNI109538_01670 [Smaragdicoccus niigatensis]